MRLLILASGWTKPDWAWFPLRAAVKHTDTEAITLPYPSKGVIPIEECAQTAKALLDDLRPAYEEVHFVGHSMGGLIGRYLIQRMNVDYFKTYTSIGTPHQGTYAAYLALWSKSARQMRPNSKFLWLLNKMIWPSHIPALTIRSQTDELILPASNALFSHCRKDVIVPKSTHCSLLFDPRVHQEVLQWFDQQSSHQEDLIAQATS